MNLAAHCPVEFRAGLDRRRDERFPATGEATVRLLETGQLLPGTVLDLSKRGLKLRLDCPLKPSTLVEIRVKDAMILGEVVHCRAAESGYVVGVYAEHGIFGLLALAESLKVYW